MRFFDLRLHFTHKAKIKKLYLEGFSVNELALMYKVPEHVINRLTRLLIQPDRI